MDFPCTQLLVDDLNESGLSDSVDKKQIGTLTVIGDKKLGIDEQHFPVYEGDNVIGRHENCDISIPVGVALSKKHACLEADKASCVVYDCGSSNKTKLGNLRLKPHVRYCLQDGNSIVFANVKCLYKQFTEKSSDSTPRSSLSTPGLLVADTPFTTALKNGRKDLNATISELVPDSQTSNQLHAATTESVNGVSTTEVGCKDNKIHAAEEESSSQSSVQTVETLNHARNSCNESDSDTDLENTIPCSENPMTKSADDDSDATDVEEMIDMVAETPRTSFVATPDQEIRKDIYTENSVGDTNPPASANQESSGEENDLDEEYSLLPIGASQLIALEVKKNAQKRIVDTSIETSSLKIAQQSPSRSVFDKVPDVTVLTDNVDQMWDGESLSSLKEDSSLPAKVVQHPMSGLQVDEKFSETNLKSIDPFETNATFSSTIEDLSKVPENLQGKPDLAQNAVDMQLQSDPLDPLSPTPVKPHELAKNLSEVEDIDFETPVLEEKCVEKVTIANHSDILQVNDNITEKSNFNEGVGNVINVSELTSNSTTEFDLVLTQVCGLKDQSLHEEKDSLRDSAAANLNSLNQSDTFNDDLITQPSFKEICEKNENTGTELQEDLFEEVCTASNDSYSKNADGIAAQAHMTDSVKCVTNKCTDITNEDTENDSNKNKSSMTKNNFNKNKDSNALPYEPTGVSADNSFAAKNEDNVLNSFSKLASCDKVTIVNNDDIPDELVTTQTNLDSEKTLNENDCQSPLSSSKISVQPLDLAINEKQAIADADRNQERFFKIEEKTSEEKVEDNNVSSVKNFESAAPNPDLSCLFAKKNNNLSIYNLALPDSYISDGEESDEDIFHSTPTSDVENDSYACAETQAFCDAGSSAVSKAQSLLSTIPEQLKTTSTPLKSIHNRKEKEPQNSPSVLRLPSSASKKVCTLKKDIPLARSRRKGRGQNKKFTSDIYDYSASTKSKVSPLKNTCAESCNSPPTISPTSNGINESIDEDNLPTQSVFTKPLTPQRPSNAKNNEELNVSGTHFTVKCKPKAATKRKNSRQKKLTQPETSSETNPDNLTSEGNNEKKSLSNRRTTRASKSNSCAVDLQQLAEENGAEVCERGGRIPNTRKRAKRKTQKVPTVKSEEKIRGTRKSKRSLPHSESLPCKSPKIDVADAANPPEVSSASASSSHSIQSTEGKRSRRKMPSRKVNSRRATKIVDPFIDEASKSSKTQAKRRKTKSITVSKDVDNNSGAELNENVVQSAALALRPRKLKPKVMFTGVIDKFGESIVRELGGHLTDDMHECTHLVTDKMRRTVKFLCAVVRGSHIVTQEWLRQSKECKRFLAEDEFELSEDVLSQSSASAASPFTGLEDQYQFKLTSALATARSREVPLFHGYRIHVTKNVLPPPDQMYQIIECGGGKRVAKLQSKNQLSDVIVVSTEEDKRHCSAAMKNGIPIVDKEFILTGILRQKLDVQNHRLFNKFNQETTTQSTSSPAGVTTRNNRHTCVSPASCRSTRSRGRRKTAC